MKFSANRMKTVVTQTKFRSKRWVKTVLVPRSKLMTSLPVLTHHGLTLSISYLHSKFSQNRMKTEGAIKEHTHTVTQTL